jgi:hypothetical protein
MDEKDEADKVMADTIKEVIEITNDMLRILSGLEPKHKSKCKNCKTEIDVIPENGICPYCDELIQGDG